MNDIRVLIMREVPADASGIVKVLGEEGFIVSEVDTRDAALEALVTGKYGLVVAIPRTSPGEIFSVSDLFGDGEKRDLPPVLLMVTGECGSDQCLSWLEGGMGYYMTFPFGRHHFISVVNDILSHPRGVGEELPVKIDLPIGSTTRSMDLMPSCLGKALVSSFENVTHQRRLLQRYYRKTRIVHDPASEGDTVRTRRNEERIRREEELIEGIERDQFELFYQPIVDLGPGTISGFEALMRWRHPERGFISPGEFIPLAEETGLIIPLGLHAVENAARQLKTWHAAFPDRTPVTASVNLSTVQFIHPDLAEQIDGIVGAVGLDYETLRFEITESALMGDMDSANIMLLKLKSMKFKLYMDDFGTGYSSLSYLRHFPVDVLKVDQSFVKWMGVDEESSQIVKTIIDLAHNLRMEVVAEGIETEEHLDELRALGCDYGQGFLFSKPVEAAEATRLLKEGKRW